MLVSTSLGWGLSLGVRTIYPVLLPHIRVAYELDLRTAGFLLTVLFLLYELGQFPSRILADRFGGRAILILVCYSRHSRHRSLSLSFRSRFSSLQPPCLASVSPYTLLAGIPTYYRVSEQRWCRERYRFSSIECWTIITATARQCHRSPTHLAGRTGVCNSVFSTLFSYLLVHHLSKINRSVHHSERTLN